MPGGRTSSARVTSERQPTSELGIESGPVTLRKLADHLADQAVLHRRELCLHAARYVESGKLPSLERYIQVERLGRDGSHEEVARK